MSDGGDTIAGYIAEKQVSQVTIGRIELGDIGVLFFYLEFLFLHSFETRSTSESRGWDFLDPVSLEAP